MRRFLDTSVLIESCLAQSRDFAAADALIKASGSVTSAHALAEAYATLSGEARLKMPPAAAARIVAELAQALEVQSLSAKSHLKLIHGAPEKGISGGSFFDAIHAQVARESRCEEIHTLNLRHFKHVAPDLTVRSL